MFILAFSDLTRAALRPHQELNVDKERDRRQEPNTIRGWFLDVSFSE
jgi:hypothetical protein